MHEAEIAHFLRGLELAKNEFYVDAIHEFETLLKQFPESELADDAVFNTGLCYFNMNQFAKAAVCYGRVISEYPAALISILDGGNEFGRTAAKAHYGILNCHIALGEIKKAREVISILDSYQDSYLVVNMKHITFKELAEKAISVYQKTIT